MLVTNCPSQRFLRDLTNLPFCGASFSLNIALLSLSGCILSVTSMERCIIISGLVVGAVCITYLLYHCGPSGA